MSPWYRLVLGALVVWRVTHFFQAEDGPWDIVVRLRRAAGQGFLGKLLDCFYCLSMWVSAPLGIFFGESWTERLLLVLALSAAASLAERATAREEARPQAWYQEDREVDHGVLRKDQDPDQPAGHDPS
jgi:hypothetical protein